MALLQISEPEIYKTVVGIDLGTTNSLVASVIDGKAVILANNNLEQLVPSIAYYGDSLIVGRRAKNYLTHDPQNTISSIKRFIGKNLADIEQNKYLYKFTANDKLIQIETKQGNRNAIQVSADILSYLKTIALNNLGNKLDGVVITVPAYFDETQRQATKQAANLAGLDVIRLLNEPTAAAIAYGLDKKVNGTFLVYDLGGGTLDVSILNLNQGVFEVLAVSGNTNLGGDDFDYLVYDYMMTKHSLGNLSLQDKAKLLDIAKDIKENLTIQIEAKHNIVINDMHVDINLNQQEFYDLSQNLITKAMTPIKKALRDAKLSTENINEIIMVGGASRMPNIRNSIKDFFNKELLTTIDPDKVVALGAAIQADILVNQNDDMLLLDVTPLSLGIETMGGLVEKIIPRNSVLPISKAQDFTTYKDNQTAMSIHVLQGEREEVANCRSLAKFSLKGIPAMAAGSARIRITFAIDADGLLSVFAMEQTTKVTSFIEVKPSFGLTDDELENMLSSSINYANQDIQTREHKETIIKARQLVDTVKIVLQKDGALISQDEQNDIEKSIQELEQLINNNDSNQTAQIKDYTIKLNSITQNLATKRMDKAIQIGLTGININTLK